MNLQEFCLAGCPKWWDKQTYVINLLVRAPSVVLKDVVLDRACCNREPLGDGLHKLQGK